MIPLLDAALKVLDKVLPDPQAKAEAKLRVLELQQSGELAALQAETALAQGQLEVNKAEAASTDWFRAGWRPSAGYVCVLGLGYQMVARPVLVAAGVEAPDLDTGDLMTILLGMLGLGTTRAVEKIRGVA